MTAIDRAWNTMGQWNGRGGWLDGPDALKPWREPWPDDAEIVHLDAEMARRADLVPWTYEHSPECRPPAPALVAAKAEGRPPMIVPRFLSLAGEPPHGVLPDHRRDLGVIEWVVCAAVR